MRRSHHALENTQVMSCKQCKSDILPHTACQACGFYKGKEVASVKGKLDKKLQKKKDKDKKA